MKTNKELLSSILKTTQMGQVGIRSVLDSNMRPTLRKALESQLTEYDSIETEAHCIASSRGWQVPELDPMIRTMADMMTRVRLKGGNTDSKIAGMMIQGNTEGMILVLKNLREKWLSQIMLFQRCHCIFFILFKFICNDTHYSSSPPSP